MLFEAMDTTLGEGELPRTFQGDTLLTSTSAWWGSGFYPGSLWYIYYYTGDSEVKALAEKYTERLYKESLKARSHAGQEIGLSRRLEFFEKDPITDWSSNDFTTFFKGLVDFRHAHKALAAGEKGGPIEYLKGYPSFKTDCPRGVESGFRRYLKDGYPCKRPYYRSSPGA